MINIYKKTEEEIKNGIKQSYRFAELTMSERKKVCPTYIVKSNGEKIDTDDLSEDEIINLFTEDFEDYFSSPKNGTYKTGRPAHNNLDNLENLITIGRHNPDSFILAEILENRKFSYEAIMDLVDLRYNNGSVGAIVVDTLRGPASVIVDAQLAANAYKRSQGDFSSIESELIVCMVDEMRLRDIAKEQQSILAKYKQ